LSIRKHRNLVIVGAGFLILFVFMQGIPAPTPAPQQAPQQAPAPAPTPAPQQAPAPAPTPAPQQAPAPAPEPIGNIATQVNVEPSQTSAILKFIVDVCPKTGDCKRTVVKSETSWLETIMKALTTQSVFQDSMEIERHVFRIQVEGKEYAEVKFFASTKIMVVDTAGKEMFSVMNDIPAVTLGLTAGGLYEPYSYPLSVSQFDSKLIVDGTYIIKAVMNVVSGRFVYKADFEQQIIKRTLGITSNQVMIGGFIYTLGFDFVRSSFETRVVDQNGAKIDIAKWRYKAGDTIHLYFPRDGVSWIVLGATTPGLQADSNWVQKIDANHYDIHLPSSFTTPTVLLIDIHFSDDRTQILVSVNG